MNNYTNYNIDTVTMIIYEKHDIGDIFSLNGDKYGITKITPITRTDIFPYKTLYRIEATKLLDIQKSH